MESELREDRIASFDLLPAQDCAWGDQPSWSRAGWTIVRIVMMGLLATYLFGWVQDLQRVSRLEAEPSPPLIKIITKHEAWLRIHPIRSIHEKTMKAPEHQEAIPSRGQ